MTKKRGLPQNEECVKRAHEVKDRAKELGVNSYLANKWKVLNERGVVEMKQSRLKSKVIVVICISTSINYSRIVFT